MRKQAILILLFIICHIFNICNKYILLLESEKKPTLNVLVIRLFKIFKYLENLVKEFIPQEI